MKHLLLIITIVLILTWPSGGINSPKVNADDFIFGPDSLAVAGLFVMMDGDIKDPKPDDTPIVSEVCKCKNGKISYDGGRSLTTCPCANGGKPCGCVNCKKSGDSVGDIPEVVANSIYSGYHIKKFTATWCAPCIAWGNKNSELFKNAGIELKPIDVDKSTLDNEIGISAVPRFLVFTTVDNFYHQKTGGGYYGGEGSGFTLEQAKAEIETLDSVLHPNRASGLFYERQQDKQTLLNNKKWASKAEYIKHLTEHVNHKNDVAKWPLKKLSVYELKAIHDDDHAGKLGKLNGL